MNEVSVIVPENFVTDEVNQFRKRLINLINSGERNFRIDFSKCNFIDSTGLGVLVSIHKKCITLNGKFKLFTIKNPNVMKIFELTRLSSIFEIEN